MTHYTIDYSPTGPDARTRALIDIREWLGAELMAKCEATVRANPISRNQFRILCSFLGIRWFPVTVWADALGIPADPPETDPDTTATSNPDEAAQ